MQCSRPAAVSDRLERRKMTDDAEACVAYYDQRVVMVQSIVRRLPIAVSAQDLHAAPS